MPQTKILLFGFIFGLLSIFSPGSIFIAMAVLTIFFLLSRYDGTSFLRNIFVYGLTLRIFAVLLLVFAAILLGKKSLCHYGITLPSFFEDSAYYTAKSWIVAEYFLGVPLDDWIPASIFSSYGAGGHLYIMAAFYSIVGFSPVSVTFINCISSVLTSVIYYFMAKEIADIKAAKITALLTVFFPSLFLWSITNLKEPLFIFFTGLMLWMFMCFLKRNKIIYLLLALTALILQCSIRPLFLWVEVFTFGLCYVLVKKKIKINHIFLLFIILIIAAPVVKSKLNAFKTFVVSYQRGVVSSGGEVYRLYGEHIYGEEYDPEQVSYFGLLKGMLKGWIYRFFTPFPWQIFSKSSLVSLPQMIIWYFLLPFSLLGILIQLRYNWRKGLVLIIYFAVVGSAISFIGGNIGTDFRTRDMLTPIVLLFSSIGLSRIFAFKEAIAKK